MKISVNNIRNPRIITLFKTPVFFLNRQGIFNCHMTILISDSGYVIFISEQKKKKRKLTFRSIEVSFLHSTSIVSTPMKICSPLICSVITSIVIEYWVHSCSSQSTRNENVCHSSKNVFECIAVKLFYLKIRIRCTLEINVNPLKYQLKS